jgi:hypothetical protein
MKLSAVNRTQFLYYLINKKPKGVVSNDKRILTSVIHGFASTGIRSGVRGGRG